MLFSKNEMNFIFSIFQNCAIFAQNKTVNEQYYYRIAMARPGA